MLQNTALLSAPTAVPNAMARQLPLTAPGNVPMSRRTSTVPTIAMMAGMFPNSAPKRIVRVAVTGL